MLLAIAGLLVSVLLLTSNAVNLTAFKPAQEPSRSPTSNPPPLPSGSAASSPIMPQQQQPSFSSPITPPAQQQQPSFSSPITPPAQQQQPVIPGVIPVPIQEQPESIVPGITQGEQQQPECIVPGITQGEQQQPEQATSQGPVEGFKASGTINSLISTSGTKWIATGNWSMFAGNGNIICFITNMIWYKDDGTGTHTHEFQKLVPIVGNVTLGSDNSLHLNGLMDVGTNNRIVWKNVHSLIDIKGGKTVSMSVDDQGTNNHFGGQPIYGVVTSLIRCSDEPGPNMEILSPCTSS
jgi:hypothetical protein